MTFLPSLCDMMCHFCLNVSQIGSHSSTVAHTVQNLYKSSLHKHTRTDIKTQISVKPSVRKKTTFTHNYMSNAVPSFISDQTSYAVVRCLTFIKTDRQH